MAETEVVDLTGEDDSADPPPLPGIKRQRLAAGRTSSGPAQPTYLSLPGGVLDDSVLGRVDAIAQQENCVGCDGRGLAAAVAEKLPYGCSYADRRRMPPANKFAVPEDRALLGTRCTQCDRERRGSEWVSECVCE
jgi:hypothetical protein